MPVTVTAAISSRVRGARCAQAPLAFTRLQLASTQTLRRATIESSKAYLSLQPSSSGAARSPELAAREPFQRFHWTLSGASPEHSLSSSLAHAGLTSVLSPCSISCRRDSARPCGPQEAGLTQALLQTSPPRGHQAPREGTSASFYLCLSMPWPSQEPQHKTSRTGGASYRP